MQLPAELVAKCPSRHTLAVASVVYGTVPYPKPGQIAVCTRSKAWIREAAGVGGKALERASAWLVSRGFVRRHKTRPDHHDWQLVVLPTGGYAHVTTPRRTGPSEDAEDGGTDTSGGAARTPVSEPHGHQCPTVSTDPPPMSEQYGHQRPDSTDTSGGHIGDRRGLEGTTPPIPPSGAEAVVSPTSPKPRKRRARGFDPDLVERQQLEQVLAVLHEARSATGMPVPSKPYAVGPTHAAPFLRRLRELVADGEDDPVALLAAVVRAKVAEHAQSEDERKASGQYATGETICRPSWWPSNLEAGRAWLDGKRPRPRQQRSKSGAYIPRGTVPL